MLRHFHRVRRASISIGAALLLAPLGAACGSDEPSLGERVEETADEAADQIDETADKASEKMKEAREEVGDEIDDHTSGG